jgi:hypothetical protein
MEFKKAVVLSRGIVVGLFPSDTDTQWLEFKSECNLKEFNSFKKEFEENTQYNSTHVIPKPLNVELGQTKLLLFIDHLSYSVTDYEITIKARLA